MNSLRIGTGKRQISKTNRFVPILAVFFILYFHVSANASEKWRYALNFSADETICQHAQKYYNSTLEKYDAKSAGLIFEDKDTAKLRQLGFTVPKCIKTTEEGRICSVILNQPRHVYMYDFRWGRGTLLTTNVRLLSRDLDDESLDILAGKQNPDDFQKWDDYTGEMENYQIKHWPPPGVTSKSQVTMTLSNGVIQRPLEYHGVNLFFAREKWLGGAVLVFKMEPLDDGEITARYDREEICFLTAPVAQ